MGRQKQPKEKAELTGSAVRNPARYNGRGSSKTSVKIHAKKPKFRNEATGFAWDSIVPSLEALKILTVQDVPTLHEMFDVHDTLQDVKCQLIKFNVKHGIDTINGDKELIGMQSKLVAQMNNLNGTWIKYCARFGITPTDRNSLSLPDTGEDDPLAVVLGD